MRALIGPSKIWIKKPIAGGNSRYRWDVLAGMNLGLGQLRVTRVSMIGRCLSILLACIFLTACSYPNVYSTSRDVKFSKRGTTQQQLDADWSACRRDNTVAMSFAEAYTEPKRTISYAEEYLINGCMAAKGYTVTW
jgi:hypothetical protein